MSVKQQWNPELYEARHSFVWEFGKGVLELLAPQSGERILDLGCGPGQLTARLAESGVDVVGLDSSPDMVGQARQNFPQLKFVLSDAAAMEFRNEFDAIFSNAALHWMLDASAVAHSMANALKPGGRLAAEFGGKGNVAHIEAALHSVLPRYYGDRQTLSKKTFFPSLGGYASILESAGFEVRQALLFDRPTPLQGENGMADWLRQFYWYHFEPIPAARREQAVAEVVEALRPALYRDGHWSADYRRLRIAAVKPAIG